jgi:tartrate dehydrogenase/decarboxylase/D-malate dehydrogenase
MFEPVHGSAPDIYGQKISNPIGAIWSGAMMLQHLGYSDAHDMILNAIETVLRSGMELTPDMGGKGNTEDLGKAISTAM